MLMDIPTGRGDNGDIESSSTPSLSSTVSCVVTDVPGVAYMMLLSRTSEDVMNRGMLLFVMGSDDTVSMTSATACNPVWMSLATS